MPVKQNPLERWKPPAELVERARKHDPMVIVGVASAGEIARLEVLVAAAQAEKDKANSPAGRERAELSALCRRAEEARNRVGSLQAELKARGVSRELAILISPADLREPDPITRSASIAEMTSQANGFESWARRLSGYIVEWPQLSLEQQNRKLILALAERLKNE